MGFDILYEDNHVIVCYKEAGILSQKDITGDSDIQSMIKAYIKEKYQKPGNVYLGLVHRLDRMTSGLMVFAKTSKAASRLSEAIKMGDFSKKYLAVCIGSIKEKEKQLIDYLSHDEKNNMAYIDKNGKKAILNFKTLEIEDNNTLIEVELLTGRHHQIRCQMASFGYPLYGDIKYGAKKEAPLALEAYYLSFVHPVTKEVLVFQKHIKKGIFKIFKYDC